MDVILDKWEPIGTIGDTHITIKGDNAKEVIEAYNILKENFKEVKNESNL